LENSAIYLNIPYKGKEVPLHAKDTLGGRGGIGSYSFTASVLNGGEWSA
jgi:hypothetical protein